MESELFWVSPERVRGSRTFTRCTRCGRPLFPLKSDVLAFAGTYPRQVLCSECLESLRSSRTGAVSLSLRESIKGALRGSGQSVPILPLPSLVSLVMVGAFLLSLLVVASTRIWTPMSPFDETRDLVLVYVPGSDDRGIDPTYLSPYVAYLDAKGSPREWLFDSFLFLSLTSNRGASFWGHSTFADWRWWAEKLFRKGEQLDALNREVGRVSKILGQAPRRGVIVSIPYPDPSVGDFGSPGGERLSFQPVRGDQASAQRARLEACRWLVDEVIKRWEERSYDRLHLLGFYWFQEEIGEGDEALINDLADYIHSRGYRFFWIPYNSERNLEWVEAYGRGDLRFDQVWIQPNYAFSDPRYEKGEDLDLTVEKATELKVSIEIELDRDALLSGDMSALNRFYQYLDGGLTHGYMNQPLSYYVFPADMYRSDNPLVRQSYDALCEFVRGRHLPFNYAIHLDLGKTDIFRKASSIYLDSPTDWSSAKEVDGIRARLASPEASFKVTGLDPAKDMILSIQYLAFQEAALQIDLGKGWRDMGRLQADGTWHILHSYVNVSSSGLKFFSARFTNLTWVSDIWAYQAESVFHLERNLSQRGGVGLSTDAAYLNGSWSITSADRVVFPYADLSESWLISALYKSGVPVEMTLTSGPTSQDLLLPPSNSWTRRTFLTGPGEGKPGMTFTFNASIRLMDLSLSSPRITTDVGTAWDTSSWRHTPGIAVGRNWSTPRREGGPPYVSYRKGSARSTMTANPLGNSLAMTIVVRYRSEKPVTLRSKASRGRLAILPPTRGWGLYAFRLPPSDIPVEIELSDDLEVAEVWMEPWRRSH